MTAPRKTTNTKTTFLQIRIAPDDLKALKRMAKANQQTVSAYLRTLVQLAS